MSNGHECRCSVDEPHETFGACMRAKNIRVAYCQSWKGLDATRQKNFDKDLNAYASARRQGIQPPSTLRPAVDAAVRASDKTGTAYQA